jgi:hypothetical protein
MPAHHPGELMNAGIELLFWILFGSLILAAWAIAEIVEHEEGALPKPRMDCIDNGPLEHWEAGSGRVRNP